MEHDPGGAEDDPGQDRGREAEALGQKIQERGSLQHGVHVIKLFVTVTDGTTK